MKKLLLCALIAILIFTIAACSNSINEPNENIDKYGIFNDAYLQSDFENALVEIKADETKISDFTKIEDWAGGTKYKFTYENKITLNVYCNTTSTVESIVYGDEKIYYRGYESYDINNYVYDQGIIDILIPSSQNFIKLYLNYPSTAKFPWTSSEWSYSKYNDIYVLSSWVKASNAFGVESQSNFTIGFYIGENDTECIYIKIGDDIKVNKVNEYKQTETRKQVTPKYPDKTSSTSGNGINLVYGQLGEYGKNENDNGYSYIAYYVPGGKYTVINNGNYATFFVSKGDDTQTYRFASGSNGQTQEVIIPDGYYIELAINTNITLELLEQTTN